MPTADIPVKDLPLDTPISFEQAGTKIVVLRTNDGVYAFDDVCPHAFWPLSSGFYQNGVLECPGHAWEFDVRSGRCQTASAYCLTSVPVTVRDDIVHLAWETSSFTPRQSKPVAKSTKLCLPTT
jgi:nitrite reductase/ring-hydroxylating ferredoxin subunit